MTEQEYKQLLSPAQFAVLADAFPWGEAVRQDNHYYADAAGELERLGVTVRVRVKGGGCRLQTKSPLSEAAGLHIKRETDTPLPDLPEMLPGALLSSLLGCAVGDAARVGALTTWRRVYAPASGVELCLDENRYLGRVDYEAELEFTGDAPPPDLMDALAARGVRFTDEVRGKYARFMDVYEQSGGAPCP